MAENTKYDYLIFTEDTIYHVVESPSVIDAIWKVVNHACKNFEHQELFTKLRSTLTMSEFIQVLNRFWGMNSILGVCYLGTGEFVYGSPWGSNVEYLRYSDTDTAYSSSQLCPGDLDKINQFTDRELGPDDVFVFSAVLCNNDIDDRLDKLSVECLHQIAKLSLGKFGQIGNLILAKARIFDSEVIETVKYTKLQEPLFELKVKAFIVRKGNEKAIHDIECGKIKKVDYEIAVRKSHCSICGKDMNICHHIKGHYYSEYAQLENDYCRCYSEIDEIDVFYAFNIDV